MLEPVQNALARRRLCTHAYRTDGGSDRLAQRVITGEPWWRIILQPASERTNTLVAATVPVDAPWTRFSSSVTNARSPCSRDDVVGDDELVATRAFEDASPRLLDHRPGPQDRPAGVHAHHPLTVLPHVAHRLDVALLVGVVEGLVGGEHVSVDRTSVSDPNQTRSEFAADSPSDVPLLAVRPLERVEQSVRSRSPRPRGARRTWTSHADPASGRGAAVRGSRGR